MHRHRQVNLTSLRERAEKAIQHSEAETLAAPEGTRKSETHHLVEELRVYQTELEIQNLELSSAQGEISLTLEKYRNLFENLPLPGVVIDSQGFIVETNLIASEWLGIRRNGLSQQRSIMQLFDSDSRNQIYKVLRERENLAPQVIELLQLKFGDGQLVPCDVHIIHLLEETEHAARTLMVIVDQSAEMALQESEAFKDAILDSMPAQIAVLDRNGIIVAVNESWRRFAAENGAPADKDLHIGVRYLDVCQACSEGEPDEGALEAYNGISMVLDGRLSSFHVDYPCHSPTEERWFSLSASLLGGDSHGVVITHTNITESKRAEIAVRDSHETLCGILKTTKDGFWQLDASGVLLDVNSTYCQMSGYTREELLGMNIAELENVKDQSEIDRHIRRVIEAGSDQFESRHKRKDGSIWYVEISVTYREVAGGQLFVFLRDISERKQTEASLNAALEAAKLADQSKDAFFANITHELRTPLSAVIGFSSLARPLCSNPKQRDYLDKVNNAGKTLAGIIDDLLDLSKIAAGRLEFESEPFSLRKLVKRSLSVLSFKAEEKGLALINQVDDAIPDVFLGDALRVEQILLNLLGNAVKFTTSGRVELRIKQYIRESELMCLIIEVEDTGVGMSEIEIGQLFKPFSQAGAFVTRQFGGTGLGLSICKLLVEAMGGEIGVTSSKGKGSIFQAKIWLLQAPADELPHDEAQLATDHAQLSYKGARVLVVDDQPLNREVVEGLLALVGITPVMACNGQEAIDILEAARELFDLVLMDVQMPVMDGLTATRQIRQIDRFANLPVIAMTAHTMAHEREKSHAAGMSGHIGKPFDEEAFFRLLAKWIPETKQNQVVATATSPKPDEGFPALAGIDTAAGLALLLGNETRYRHWLSDFVTEGPAALTKIRQSLKVEDTKSAILAAHSLKGRAGILGMKSLHVIAGDVESAIDGEKPTEELLLSLQKGIDSLCEEIKRGLGLPVATPAVVESSLEKLPPGAPPDSIIRLISHLQAGDGDCDSFVADCLAELAETPWVPRLQKVHTLVQNFDFAAASRLLEDER
jgi:PAS domain S-box-containing protein